LTYPEEDVIYRTLTDFAVHEIGVRERQLAQELIFSQEKPANSQNAFNTE
jgi:hypothetical protein